MKDQYLQRLRETKENEEMQECTFSPEINPRSIEIMQQKYPREPLEDKAIKMQRLK